MKDISDVDILYKAFLRIMKCSGWKAKTQIYQNNLMFNLNRLSKSLKDGTYEPGRRTRFVISERGKTRCIEAACIDDRIVQSALCDNVLMPLCEPRLIYDNAASMKGKGTDFFRRRLEKNLRAFGHNHGNNGYILKIDFSKFFDNIRHSVFLDTMRAFGLDGEGLAFVAKLLKQYEVDVSYMDDDEYAHCMEATFDSLEYMKVDETLLTGEKTMPKSMAIGSAIAQVAGIAVPYKIDDYCKIVRGVKMYGRYMDDIYAIHGSKEYLAGLLNDIKAIAKSLGLKLNERKTCITPLSRWFTILKTQYRIMDDGRVEAKPLPSSFSRERRKIRYLAKEGMPEAKIREMYGCWRGSIERRFGECRSLISTDDYLNHLMEELKNGQKRTRSHHGDRSA